MAEPKHYLPDRQIGTNMDPWTLLVTDDRPIDEGGSGGPRDWTKAAGGSPDQHTATFIMKLGSTTVLSGACATLTANGKVVFTAGLAPAAALTVGDHRAQWLVSNAAGTLVYKSKVYGQRILANL